MMSARMMSKERWQRTRRWIYRNARPLDLARWRYHFEGGPREAAVEALAAYQNPNGGLGHALEADNWSPHSNPIQTNHGAMMLLELGWEEAGHPVVQGMLRYLGSGADSEERGWRNTVPSNNSFPSAPWWIDKPGGEDRWVFNPTPGLVGFILRFGERDSPLYSRAMELYDKGLRHARETDLEQHELMCYCDLLKQLEQADAGLPLEELRSLLREQVGRTIERDRSKWTGYVPMPSDYIKGPDSPFHPGNEAVVEAELDYLLDSQEEDGPWPVTWNWGAWPGEFAIAANWWRANFIITRLCYLRAFGRLPAGI